MTLPRAILVIVVSVLVCTLVGTAIGFALGTFAPRVLLQRLPPAGRRPV
jgi:predicted lysophospholipase L1 biosynthesis ABC-type transport system permease subunit